MFARECSASLVLFESFPGEGVGVKGERQGHGSK